LAEDFDNAVHFPDHWAKTSTFKVTVAPLHAVNSTHYIEIISIKASIYSHESPY